MGTIKISEQLSDLDKYDLLELDLYLTPGSDHPYWASRPSFMFDKVVASVWDFMDQLGFDTFDRPADYSFSNPTATIEIEPIPYRD